MKQGSIVLADDACEHSLSRWIVVTTARGCTVAFLFCGNLFVGGGDFKNVSMGAALDSSWEFSDLGACLLHNSPHEASDSEFVWAPPLHPQWKGC